MTSKANYTKIIKAEAKRLGFLSCGISKADFLEEEAEGAELLLEEILAPIDYPVVDLGLPEEAMSLWEGLQTFTGYAQRPGVYARLPFNVNIR